MERDDEPQEYAVARINSPIKYLADTGCKPDAKGYSIFSEDELIPTDEQGPGSSEGACSNGPRRAFRDLLESSFARESQFFLLQRLPHGGRLALK
jgi:hypothetical protein